MRIAKIETVKRELFSCNAVYTALRNREQRNDIVVRVTADDGRTGYGEVLPRL